MTPCWRKTLRMLPRYALLSLMRNSEFKFNFYTYLTLYLVQIALLLKLWTSVAIPPVDGWKEEHYLLLVGFSTLNFALQEFLWATAMLDYLIMEGDLIVVLSRPVDSYFGLVLRRMGAMAFLPSAMGILVIVGVVLRYELDTELWRWMAALSATLFGAIALRAGLVIAGAVAFRFGRTGFIKAFFIGSREYSRVPLTILHPLMSSFFIFILPAVAIANWPTQILTMGDSLMAGGLWLASAALCLVWVFGAAWCWSRGLRSYEGMGRWGA